MYRKESKDSVLESMLVVLNVMEIEIEIERESVRFLLF